MSKSSKGISRLGAALSVLLAAGLLVAAAPARADVTREQGVELAKKAVPGQVLKSERFMLMDRSVVWRVTILAPGASFPTEVMIDEKTGARR